MSDINPEAKRLLEDVKKCPICRGTNRLLFEGPPLSSNRYLDSICASVGVQNFDLLNLFRLYTCNDCGVLYFDPHLSLNTRLKMFTVHFPDHGIGWSRILGAERLTDRESPAIISVVRRYLNFSHYAEVNCPMMGLLPQLIKNKNFSTNKNYSFNKDQPIFFKHGRGAIWLVFQFFTGFFLFLERLRNKSRHILSYNSKVAINNFIYKHQSILPFSWITKTLTVGRASRKYEPKLSTVSHMNPEVGTVSLLTIPTTQGWGNACVRFNASCYQLIPPIPIEYAKTNELRFDLIGFFNTLDHLDDPLTVLKITLELSSAIIIRSHRYVKNGSQHALFFTETFWDNLDILIPNIKVIKLTDQALAVLGREKLGSGSESDDLYLIVRGTELKANS